MNYEQLFEQSYARVIGEGVGLGERGRKFFGLFYEIFLNKSEAISQKFHGVDMDAQVSMLEKSMFHMISFYVARSDTEYLRSISLTHSKAHHDINPEYYDSWLEALIETVARLDPEFDADHALAWQLAMLPGIAFMKSHYSDKPEF